jgi:hypothetical protein
MISFSISRVVVVAGDDRGRSLVDSLKRMRLAEVCLVETPDEARRLCAANGADACLALLPRAVPDEVPRWTAEADAPGRDAAVPSLLLAEAVTPYVAKSARNAGYVAAIPDDVPSRMLYRWIGALLQKQAQQHARTAATERGGAVEPRSDAMAALAHQMSVGGKPKLQ